MQVRSIQSHERSDLVPKGASSDVKTIEVFRAGTFQPMAGPAVTFSTGDLEKIAAGYDAENAPAPVVVGHPKTDSPAYGWIKSFRVEGEKLLADIGDLAAAFTEAVAERRYRKVSMSFFKPDAPNNPAPGAHYPKHVGFLGGAAPAVSGLKPVDLAGDDDAVTFEFADRAFKDGAAPGGGGVTIHAPISLTIKGGDSAEIRDQVQDMLRTHINDIVNAVGLPEARIRALGKEAYWLHSIKGYDGGVKHGLSLLGFRAQIHQWYNEDPIGLPNTHRIDVEIREPLFDDEPAYSEKTERQIWRMINAMKRWSQDTALRLIGAVDGPVRVGAAALAGNIVTIPPKPFTEAVAIAHERVAAAVLSATTIIVPPKPVAEMETAGPIRWALAGAPSIVTATLYPKDS